MATCTRDAVSFPLRMLTTDQGVVSSDLAKAGLTRVCGVIQVSQSCWFASGIINCRGLTASDP